VALERYGNELQPTMKKILNKINLKNLPVILSITIVSLFLLASYLGRSLSNTEVPRTTTPVQTYEPQDENSEITEEEREKINIEVFENAQKTTERGDVLFLDTGQFHLVYFSKEDEFLISILANPFEEVRRSAELAFLSTLKIDETTACKLNVTITSPIRINPDLKGQILKLSFCR
jgi:hypothetical protein